MKNTYKLFRDKWLKMKNQIPSYKRFLKLSIILFTFFIIVLATHSFAQTSTNTSAAIQSLNQSILALENHTADYPSAAVPSWVRVRSLLPHISRYF